MDGVNEKKNIIGLSQLMSDDVSDIDKLERMSHNASFAI